MRPSRQTRDQSDPRDVVRTGIAAAGLHEVLRWAVAHAALAPSELNAQPWAFSLEALDHGAGGIVHVHLDTERCLGQIDPTRREAVLACGGAVLNLRLALIGAQLLPEVALCPDPASRDLLASITVRTKTHEPEESALLRAAVLKRSTSRDDMRPEPLDAELLERLVGAAELEGAAVRVLDAEDRVALASSTLSSQERLWAQPALREEAATWTRSNVTRSGDGVPGYAYGQGDLRSLFASAVLTHGGPPPWSGEEQAAAVLGAPAVLAIGSEHDSRAEVLRAGAGMQRLLLTATAAGLSASYVNAPLHVPEARALLGELLGLSCPQVVVRVGHGTRSRLTPRRTMGSLIRSGARG